MKEYWSDSKLADWVRGTDKLKCGSIEEWNKWEETAKANHPVRFWIAEEGFDLLQELVYWLPDKIYSAKYYIANRWIAQTHALVANSKHIKRGSWAEFEQKVLYCLFDELVNYVEIQAASENYRWDTEKIKTRKWWQVGKWSLKSWRSAEDGIERITWLRDQFKEDGRTGPYESYNEILELYRWWTEIFPNREDPYITSGWVEHCKKHPMFLFNDDAEVREIERGMLDQINLIEKQHFDEEQEMLHRLIKIRQTLS